MLNVAILTGGPSAERGIALQSAALVQQHLSPDKYRHWTILVENDGWYAQDTGIRANMNDFSLDTDSGPVKFDFAFLIIHGTPVEDGRIQGYFEAMRIPHSTCNTLTSALTFNKQWCKDFLARHNVPMAWSKVVLSGELDQFAADSVTYPVFVKPNNNGSSYGVTKVTAPEQMQEALHLAARYDDEIMIEAFMDGREFSCGAVREGGTIHVFPVTEIIPDGDFFDYDAKYLGAGQEITPADMPDEESRTCRELSGRLYRLLKCKGMVRFDYILVGGAFHLLEVNTVPGLSEASIIPQQARAYGWNIERLLDVVIQDALNPIYQP